METIRDFLSSLIQTSSLEERAWDLRLARQREIGRSLYQALFGPVGIGDPGTWLHILPLVDEAGEPATRARNDEFLDFVCRVPWSLLTRDDSPNAPFLMLDALEPVAITIDAAPNRGNPNWFKHIKLPSLPRVLLVIPQTASDEPTEGAAHAKELKDPLLPHFALAKLKSNLVVVRSFRQFQTVLPQLRPHLIYFYGHGLTSGWATSFQFEAEDGGADWRDFDEIEQLLSDLVQLTQFPPVVWVNACQGAAAEQGSALRSLAPFSCCMITTRTVVALGDSRKLAATALPMIVTGGYPPPRAMREAMHRQPLSVRSARWALIVVAVQYDRWLALGLHDRNISDLDSAGDFPMRVDRTEPLAAVSRALDDQLTGSAAAPSTIVWHGPAEQGLDAFEERVAEQVLESFPNWRVIPRRIELQPLVLPSGHRARTALFCKSLLDGLLNQSPGGYPSADASTNRFQKLITNLVGERDILLLLHGPFSPEDLDLLRSYLEFWRARFLDLMPAKGCPPVILGFGLFDSVSPELKATLIQPLGSVPPRELQDHLKAYRRLYDLGEDEVLDETERITEESDGRFNDVRRALEELAGFA